MIVVIFPGGFHPFHAGHKAVFNKLVKKFPESDIFVASSPSTEERPFPFEDKKKLAVAAGVPEDKFVEVASPYKAKEILANYDPDKDKVIYALSSKDATRLSYMKKDGSPGYFQPYDEEANNQVPFKKHAYVFITPKVEFTVLGKQIDSAGKIREMYLKASDSEKRKIVEDIYPNGDISEIKKIFDKALHESKVFGGDLLIEEGTYACYKLTKESAKQLNLWMQEIGLKDPVPEEDLHVTTTYSKKTVNLSASKKMIHLSKDDYTLDVFGNAFVIKLKSPELQSVFDDAIRNGATTDYPEYNPHITISYDAKMNEDVIMSGIEPPTFDLILSHEEVRPLEENVKPRRRSLVKIIQECACQEKQAINEISEVGVKTLYKLATDPKTKDTHEGKNALEKIKNIAANKDSQHYKLANNLLGNKSTQSTPTPKVAGGYKRTTPDVQQATSDLESLLKPLGFEKYAKFQVGYLVFKKKIPGGFINVRVTSPDSEYLFLQKVIDGKIVYEHSHRLMDDFQRMRKWKEAATLAAFVNVINKITPVQEENQMAETITKEKSKWVIRSKNSHKKLGEFPSKKKAEKREKQINYFKHVKEEVISEAKKKEELKLSKTDQKTAAKLDTLLRYGLVPKNLIARAKRALIDKDQAAKVPYLRDLLIDVLSHVLKLVLDNPILYHRILRDVMIKGPIVSEQYIIEAEDEEGFSVPTNVKDSAAEGIDLRREFRRGGTANSANAAKILTTTEKVDKLFLRKLDKQLKRFEPSRKEGWDNPDKPDNSYITWKLLGGDDAQTWVRRVLDRE